MDNKSEVREFLTSRRAKLSRRTPACPTSGSVARFNHPDAGELTLAYEELAITAEPGLVLILYTAEPARLVTGDPAASGRKRYATVSPRGGRWTPSNPPRSTSRSMRIKPRPGWPPSAS